MRQLGTSAGRSALSSSGWAPTSVRRLRGLWPAVSAWARVAVRAAQAGSARIRLAWSGRAARTSRPKRLDIDSRRLVQEAVEAFYEAQDARGRLHHAVVAIADHIKAHPDSSQAIHEQCLRLMGDERDARTLSSDIEDGGHY
jgi:hypothetical protein